jgi:hypothetical protein
MLRVSRKPGIKESRQKTILIMKKISILLFTLFLFAINVIAQEKTSIGLTEAEILFLEQNNPKIKLDPSKYDPESAQYFKTVTEAQNYIDSMEIVLNGMVNIPQQEVVVNGSSAKRMTGCGCGDYSQHAGSAGLFSSFQLSFHYCDGAVSNGNIGTSGLHIGWTLGGTTNSYNGTYACSSATATFGIGIFSWTQTVNIQWHFNPSNCRFYYTVGSGSCIGAV